MPIIDVYAPEGILPLDSDRILAKRLTEAALRAERMPQPPPPAIRAITAAYIHRLPVGAVHTDAADSARVVRVQLLAAAGGLKEDGQREFVAEATEIVADVAGDLEIAASTSVVVVEAMNGWGVAGEVITKENAARLFE